MIDLNARRLTIAETADAAGLTLDTARQWTKRWPGVFLRPEQPDRLAKRGVPHILNNRAALRFVIAARLSAAGVPIAKAAQAAVAATDGARGPALDEALLVLTGEAARRVDPDNLIDAVMAAGGAAVAVLDLRPAVAAIEAKIRGEILERREAPISSKGTTHGKTG